MFYLCYLVVYLFFSLLAVRSQNLQMDGLWYVTMSCRYGVILISHDWVLCLFPIFLEKWGNCTKFLRKSDGALVRQLVVAKWCKMGNILSKEGYLPYILGGNMQVSLCPFRRKCGEHIGQVSVQSIAITLLPFTRWCRYQADSLLLWRMTE